MKAKTLRKHKHRDLYNRIKKENAKNSYSLLAALKELYDHLLPKKLEIEYQLILKYKDKNISNRLLSRSIRLKKAGEYWAKRRFRHFMYKENPLLTLIPESQYEFIDKYIPIPIIYEESKK